VKKKIRATLQRQPDNSLLAMISLSLSITLAMALLLAGLTGCTNGNGDDNSDYPAEEIVELHPEIQAIVDRGVLRVGVRDDVPGMGYFNTETQSYEGLEIDLAYMLAELILGNRDYVEFTPVSVSTRTALLDNGSLDMVIATFAIREQRKEFWNFSQPYFVCPLSSDPENPKEFAVVTRLNNPYLTGLVDNFVRDITIDGRLDNLLVAHELYDQPDGTIYLCKEEVEQ